MNTLQESGKRRDNHLRDNQSLIGGVVAIVADVVSSLLISDPEGNKAIASRLFDAAILAAAGYNNFLQARRAFAEPGLAKDIKEVLHNSEPGKFLYGDNLGERVQQSRSLAKVSATLKDGRPPQPQQQSKNGQRASGKRRRPDASKWSDNRRPKLSYKERKPPSSWKTQQNTRRPRRRSRGRQW